MEWLPSLLALAAGFFFALAVYIQRRAIAEGEEHRGSVVTVASMAGFFWLVSPFSVNWNWLGNDAVWVFAACGLFVPAISQRLQILSVGKVGPALASAVGSFAPLFAVTAAVLFLGEDVSFQSGVGLALMLSGLVLSTWSPKGVKRDWHVAALLMPIGASFFRGIAQPAVKFGIEAEPNAVFATLVMVSVSTLTALAWLKLAGRSVTPDGPWRDYRWYALNGLCLGIALLLLHEAIALGEVTVVAPLASLTPIWTLVLGALFFRVEQLRLRHLWIALVVSSGAALVVTG